jgi:acyl-CoA thioesterase FadM
MLIETPIQMRFADVDRLGHVNNVNLQHYFDLGKTDYYDRVIRLPEDCWEKTSFIQKATNSVFEAQTHMSEPVVVTTRVEKVGTTSMTVYQEILNGCTRERKAYSTSVLVAFDFAGQVKVPVPDPWRRAIEKFNDESGI